MGQTINLPDDTGNNTANDTYWNNGLDCFIELNQRKLALRAWIDSVANPADAREDKRIRQTVNAELIKECLEKATSPPVLFLHGWLDNSGSFCELIEALQLQRKANPPMLALDFAGQGRSDFREYSSPYTLYADMTDIINVLHTLDVSKVQIVGHSRGAMVAWLFAALFPERVDQCIFLDGMFPPPQSNREAISVLRSAAQPALASGRHLNVKSTRFSSYQEALLARQNGRFPVTELVARAMAQRSLSETSEGWIWRNDIRLKLPHPYRLSKDQVLQIHENFRVRSALLWSSDGLLVDRTNHCSLNNTVASLCRKSDTLVCKVSGNHHAHMGSGLQQTLQYTQEFLSK